MKSRYSYCYYLSVFLSLVQVCVRGQTSAGPVVVGEHVQIQSSVLQESRTLTISKPEGYEGTKDRYAVLYILDGEVHFPYAVGMVNFLAESDTIPKMIVVGISSEDRAKRIRDLTPPTQSEIENRFNPGNGGADNFLKFLGEELVPYVERNYRTKPYKILVGHSLGGLFALRTLLVRPTLFNAFIVIDPTLDWNKSAELARAEKFFTNTRDLQSDLFMTAANDFGDVPSSTKRLAAILAQKVPRGFRWHFEWMKDETHISIPLRSIYAGLETIFDGWHLTDPLGLFDKGGLPAIHRHFLEGGERCGYDRMTPPFTISLLVAGLIKKGRLEEASNVLLHDPIDYPAPWNQLDALARAYAGRGNSQEAIRFYRLSLKQNPSNDWARQKLTEMGVSVEAKSPDAPR